jgi:hypothetical protein
MNKLKHLRPLGLLAAVLAVAALLAACGGSSSAGGSTARAASANSRAAFTSCLKSHGVKLPTGAGGFSHKFKRGTNGGGFPGGGTGTGAGGAPGGAPAGTGGGFGGGGFGGGGFGNSKFAKAIKACQSKLPASERGKFGHGGFGGKRPSGKFKPHFNAATLDKFVACIRKSGYAAMPEAKKNSATGGFFPKSVENNADFKKALPKCESVLRSSLRSGAASGTTTGSSS